MRVVIDTNGFLSAIPAGGKNKWLYHAFVHEEFIWVVSNEIISEYSELVDFKFDSVTMNFVINSILSSENHIRYEPSFKWQLVESDPDDNKFVDCALGANVDYLVTNDGDILNLLKIPDLFPPIPIVTFEQFRRILNR